MVGVTSRSCSQKNPPTDRVIRFWASNTATSSSAVRACACSSTFRETASSLLGSTGRGAVRKGAAMAAISPRLLRMTASQSTGGPASVTTCPRSSSMRAARTAAAATSGSTGAPDQASVHTPTRSVPGPTSSSAA